MECIEELVGIDIDHETLDFNKGRARPFAADYLDPRPRPLTVSLYQGRSGMDSGDMMWWGGGGLCVYALPALMTVLYQVCELCQSYSCVVV